MYHEPVYILNEELTETATYFSLMEVISKGEKEAGVNVLKDLERKSAFIDKEGKELYFALFSKSGFTKELQHQAAEAKNLFLYDFTKGI